MFDAQSYVSAWQGVQVRNARYAEYRRQAREREAERTVSSNATR
jgi:hypothetical protein